MSSDEHGTVALGLGLGNDLGAGIGVAVGTVTGDLSFWLGIGIGLGAAMGVVYTRDQGSDGAETPRQPDSAEGLWR
jgi:hypothetical protein